MEDPWYFCFSLDKNGTKQAVAPEWHIWKNAKVKIFAYCFGLDENVVHWDWKRYFLDEGSSFEVYEFNFNSDDSYMTVYNTFTAYVWKNAYFKNHYESTMGHLGHWITKWEVFLDWENAKADFVTKNKILKWDISDLDIKFHLNWKNSSWVIISKSVTFEWWKNIFKSHLTWNWDETQGHIECSEISMGKCQITTIPALEVNNPSSRLTHEAAVWTLEQKSIENLMIKGFEEEEAIKFMINWILD
jgi:Fe-S cluster assembly scaffold protein SufB